MIIFDLIYILEVIKLLLDFHHVEMSHSEDKSDKSSLLINNQNDHSLNKDFYSFDANVSLLRVAYFDSHFNSLIGDIEVDLQCFGTILAAFIQFG